MRKSLLSFFLLIWIAINAQTSYDISGMDQLKLHVQEWGRGNPVIILAGGPALDAAYMKDVWDTLSRYLRCIVPDQRGTGKSILRKIDSSTVNMDAYVNDLEALRIHLQLDKLALVGHSWGGMLAMEYAARFPQHVKQLVLLDPGGPTRKFWSYFQDNANMRLTREDLKEIQRLDSLRQSDFVASMPGFFYSRQKALDYVAKTDPSALEVHQIPVYELAVASYDSVEANRAKLLSRYKGKVSIIQGRQDPVGESTAFEIRTFLPQTKIYFVERSGHFPWAEGDEQAHEFYRALTACFQ